MAGTNTYVATGFMNSLKRYTRRDSEAAPALRNVRMVNNETATVYGRSQRELLIGFLGWGGEDGLGEKYEEIDGSKQDWRPY